MQPYSWPLRGLPARVAAFFTQKLVRAGAAGLLLALLPLLAQAQATPPAWQVAMSGNSNQPDANNTSQVRATAVDARGNVFITGSFVGTIHIGTTRLVGVNGSSDMFVAKWDATAKAFTWATSGGGRGSDQGSGIAVSGTNVYVTGYFVGDAGVSIAGQPLAGPSTGPYSGNTDVFVAKYIDTSTGNTPATSSFANGWATSGGGTGGDFGYGIAVSGTSVYVTGSFLSATNASFAGKPLAGTGTSGTPDMFVAKYVDNGSSFTNGWVTNGGSRANDYGYGIAASGTSVYVTGSFMSGNNASIAGQVLPGLGREDMFVAKYIDNGSSFANGWAISDGGAGIDVGRGVAVSGTGVYVSGYFYNSTTSTGQPIFAGQPLVDEGNGDMFVAKYIDTSTGSTPATSSFANGWATSGGGTGNDYGYGIAVSGPDVYVTGYFTSSSTAGFAGLPLPGSSMSIYFDMFVAKYVDTSTGNTPATSSFANGWAASAGGPGGDEIGYGIAVSGTSVYAVGDIGTGGGRFGPMPATQYAPPNSAALGALDPATGTWQQVDGPLQGGTSYARATAVDARGNVFITGYFSGSVGFGSTRLVSAGVTDVFLAKWDATTQAFAWATRCGGTGADYGSDIAVSGTNVYLTGSFVGTGSFAGQAVLGRTGEDMFVAKYVDQGSSVANGWATSGGGRSSDVGIGVAVSGPNVYVTGTYVNFEAIFAGQPLGNTGSNGVFLVKYLDNGSSFTNGWVTTGEGTSGSVRGIAASGSGVYITGGFRSGTNVSFAGQALPGAGAADMYVAKYVDNGSSVANGWAISDGGNGNEIGTSIAVSGTGVYVTGDFASGNGSTIAGQPLPGTGTAGYNDIFVAKYIDTSTGSSQSVANGWATSGGGTSEDNSTGIAVSGTSVYVMGRFYSSTNATFAGQVLLSTGNYNTFVAKYVDTSTGNTPATSSFANGWAISGGSTGSDIAVSGTSVYVVGSAAPPTTFGNITFGNNANAAINFLAGLTDAGPSAPLPVVLVAFAATAEGPAAVRLTWATASERNSRSFEVERSADGVAFAAIGTVAAAGTTATARTYALRDAALPAGAAVLYYRLRQLDLDGTAHYSPVRSVAVAGGLSLYPNPALGGAATLSGAAPGTAVQVLDALGRVAATAPADANGTATLPAGLAPGVYVVRAGSAALRLTVE